MCILSNIRLLALLSVFIAQNSQSSVDRLSNDELWDRATVVAIVQIVEGSYTRAGYELVARTQVVLKGPLVDEIRFRINFPNRSFTERLGYSYLVHLEPDEDGNLDLLFDVSAAIEIDEHYEKQLEFFREENQRLDRKFRNYFISGDRLWVVHCPDHEPERWCQDRSATVESAFNNNKLSGRPYRPPQL